MSILQLQSMQHCFASERGGVGLRNFPISLRYLCVFFCPVFKWHPFIKLSGQTFTWTKNRKTFHDIQKIPSTVWQQGQSQSVRREQNRTEQRAGCLDFCNDAQFYCETVCKQSHIISHVWLLQAICETWRQNSFLPPSPTCNYLYFSAHGHHSNLQTVERRNVIIQQGIKYSEILCSVKRSHLYHLEVDCYVITAHPVFHSVIIYFFVY